MISQEATRNEPIGCMRAFLGAFRGFISFERGSILSGEGENVAPTWELGGGYGLWRAEMSPLIPQNPANLYLQPHLGGRYGVGRVETSQEGGNVTNNAQNHPPNTKPPSRFAVKTPKKRVCARTGRVLLSVEGGKVP